MADHGYAKTEGCLERILFMMREAAFLYGDFPIDFIYQPRLLYINTILTI